MKDLSNKIAKAKDRVMEDMYGLITKCASYWAWTDEEKAQLRRMAFLLSLPDDEDTTLAALSVNYASDSEEVEMPEPSNAHLYRRYFDKYEDHCWPY